jgi:hypothetical protein
VTVTRPFPRPRVAPLALAAATLAAGCEYVRRVRPSVVEQLDPRVVRLVASLLATAGGVVFSGESAGMFDAFDARSGALPWQFRTGRGIHSNPITWAVGGERYVAVPAGCGGWVEGFAPKHCGRPRAVSLVASALP